MCKKNVYTVKNEKELSEAVAKNLCVKIAIEYDNNRDNKVIKMREQNAYGMVEPYSKNYCSDSD